MKSLRKIFLGSMVLTGVLFTLNGCVADGSVGVGVREDVYYGPHRDPWFRDDRWMDGHGWYRGEPRGNSVDLGIYISPPRRRRW